MNIKFKILVLLLVSNFTIAQNSNMTNKEVNELKSLGKQAIIELALKRLNKDVDTSYFKSIKVMASDNDIYVSFDNPIKFVPENSVYYYNAVVFINGVMSRGPFKNPEDIDYYSSQVKFLKYDDIILDKIKFVIKAISIQDEVETIDWEYYEDYNGMLIYDKGDHYYVDKSYGEYNEAAYTIDKNTGIAVEEYHADILPDHYASKVKYVEIKN